MNKFYLCTAIAYTNAPPHVGHMLEFVFSDVIARYHQLIGDDMQWSMGTDENGSKMYKTAKEQGIETRELADRNQAIFLDLWEKLRITDHLNVRTTDEAHHKGCQTLWKMLDESGDIYKDSYKGLYCVGCEAFLNEKDLVDGNCPNHLKPPEELEESNYFFRLSKYNDEIKRLIETDELKVFPDSKKREMIAMCEEGLRDVSFSRPKTVLPWGVDVPGDPDQVMYVWCDALSNYITVLGFGEDSPEFKDRKSVV